MPLKYQGELNQTVLADSNNTHAKVLSLVGNGKRVLEVGCAVGYMTRQMIYGQACEVTALEIDEEAAVLAKDVGATVLIGDIEEEGILEQLDGQFEVVVMADVLEHLREPGIALQRLRSLIAPRGRLILSVPNIAHWSIRVGLMLGRFDYCEKGILDIGHLRFFTQAFILQLLNEAGYNITHFDAMYVFPFHRRFGLRHLVAKRKLPKALSGVFGYQFVIEAELK